MNDLDGPPSGFSSPATRNPAPVSDYPYATHLDVLFAPMTTISLDPIVAGVRDQWWNQTLCQVNDSVLRLGVMQGEYHWHKHDDDDELFYIVEGTFLLDFDPDEGGRPGRVVSLEPRQAFVIPRGVVHRTRAPERCVILMVENKGIIPTGD